MTGHCAVSKFRNVPSPNYGVSKKKTQAAQAANSSRGRGLTWRLAGVSIMVACESRRSAHHVEEEGANEGVSRHPSKSNRTLYAGQVDVEKYTLVRFKST